MLCQNPYMVGVMPCACGQCVPCRQKRKKLWASRIMLESLKHGDSSFVTLTYDEKNCPPDGSLNPKHAQDWLKRLRIAIEPRKIRYYLCGEYGAQTWRPHYHAIIFGLSPLEQDLVRSTWNKGHIVMGDLTLASASYVAGYVTKKMGKQKGDAALNGKHAEFQRMSLRPGVGALAISDITKVLTTEFGKTYLSDNGDVPHSLNIGREKLQLGRYLRGKLREELGHDKKTPEEVLKIYALTMRIMQEEYVKNSQTSSRSSKKLVLDMNKQKSLNYLTKIKILQGAKKL